MKQTYLENVKAILNQAPCGIGLFLVQDKNSDLSTLYLNNEYFNIIGYTREEYEKEVKNPLSLMLSEDINTFEINKHLLIEKKSNAKSEYRILQRTGQIKWVKISLSKIKIDEKDVIFASFLDMQNEHEKQKEQIIEKERYRLVVEQTGATVFEWNLENGKFYNTPSYFQYAMSDLSSEDISNNKGSLDVVHPDDVAILLQFFADTKSGKEKVETVLRFKMKNQTYRWNRMIGLFYKKRVIGIIIDIHEEREKSDTLNSILNAIPGGVGMYCLDEKFTPLYFNDQVAHLCGLSRKEYEIAIQDGANSVIHPDDFVNLLVEVKAALEEKRTASFTYRLLQKDKSYRWTHLSGDWLPNKDDSPVLCAVFTDVNEQKTMEQSLKESDTKYQIAIKAAGINVWEYDLINDYLSLISNSARIKNSSLEIDDFIQFTISNNFIDKDSIADFINVYDQLKAGVKEVSADLWYKTSDQLEGWCEHITYSNIFNDENVPVKAFGVSRDVTREKEAEKRYRHELAYREVMQKATVASLNMNLTQNILVDYKSEYAEITTNMQKATSAQAYFETIYEQIDDKEMLKLCKETLNVNGLLNRFLSGENSITMELIRNIDGTANWVEFNVDMMKATENNDVIAFLYSIDITNEKVMQNVMDTVIKTDYDYLVVVDAIRNSAKRYSDNEDYIYAKESDDFEQCTRAYIKQFVCAEDVDELLDKFTLKNIIQQLDKYNNYNLYYKLISNDGRIRRKQLKFNYIHPEYKVFLLTRIDITEIYEETEKRNQELSRALKLAEQASATKTEFLSRMSHEIRTPMNAIIGMAEIALANIEDQEFVSKCIRNSQEASKYLLLIINDILDMSRIESGKQVLMLKPFKVQNLFESINTIMKTQASIENITYLFESDNRLHPVYIGDETRIKQILINLLNNAIKFTNVGGIVNFSVSQHQEKDGIATLKFVVSDTGIGMDPSFLEKLFDPFTQENNVSNTHYAGSGLGLSIAKNLANLMGGDIFVSSKLNEGTTFTIIIEVAIADQSEQQNVIINKIDDYAFEGKKILLFEDHPLNIIVAKKLLEMKGFYVESAKDGQEGLSIIEKSPINYFDAILMDIRMPVMDGLQATEKIRNMERKDMKEIPIIAMSANAFDEDIKKSLQVGMNAHLSKPIEPNKLYQTLASMLK